MTNTFSLLVFSSSTGGAICEKRGTSTLTPEQIVDALRSEFHGVVLSGHGVAAMSKDLAKSNPWYRESLQR